ncbi:MAG: hypothetical protein V7K69_20480 [Nostoc sp.]
MTTAYDVGIQAFLSKPFTASQLLQIISTVKKIEELEIGMGNWHY